MCLCLKSNSDVWSGWEKSQRYGCPRENDHFTELNQEGFMETKASYIYFFIFYNFYDLCRIVRLWQLSSLYPQISSAEDSNILLFSFILIKSCYSSLQIALSVASLCWVWTMMHIPWQNISLWLPLFIQLHYSLSCCSLIEKDCHCSHYKM